MCGRRIELIYGGAASGKSEFAEREALGSAFPLYYLATMRLGTEAGDIRIKKHEQRRIGKGFITIECPVDIDTAASKVQGGTVLLECLTNLAANEMFRNEAVPCEATLNEWTEGLFGKLLKDILEVSDKATELILVSGDIMRDGERYGKETEAYIRLMGMLNKELSGISERVYEVIYGCPKRIK